MNSSLIIQASLGIIGVLVVRLIDKMEKSISKLTESMEKLNVKLAITVEKVDTQDKRISRLEKKETHGLMKATHVEE